MKCEMRGEEGWAWSRDKVNACGMIRDSLSSKTKDILQNGLWGMRAGIRESCINASLSKHPIFAEERDPDNRINLHSVPMIITSR